MILRFLDWLRRPRAHRMLPGGVVLAVADRSDLAECKGPFRESDLRSVDRCNAILIHRNTAGPDAAGVHKFHSSGEWAFRLFPYHFFVDYVDASDEKGERGEGPVKVEQIHPLDVKSPHAGNRNGKTIGIALNVDGREYAPSSAMLEAVVELCALLRAAYPKLAVLPHNPEKPCPGRFVPVDWIDCRSRMIVTTRAQIPDLSSYGIRVTTPPR